MPWTAPPITPTLPPRPAAERPSLDGFLDRHRAMLLASCAGLDGQQLARRPIASSSLSLLGLVRHLTEVERIWFRYRFAGEPVGPVYPSDEHPEADFELVEPAGASDDFDAYQEEVRTCRELVADRSLDERFVFGRAGLEVDLRYVYLHLIEEYAQHNGHADILRELVDGARATDR